MNVSHCMNASLHDKRLRRSQNCDEAGEKGVAVAYRDKTCLLFLFNFFLPQKGQKGRLDRNIIIYLNETRELKRIYVFLEGA